MRLTRLQEVTDDANFHTSEDTVVHVLSPFLNAWIYAQTDKYKSQHGISRHCMLYNQIS